MLLRVVHNGVDPARFGAARHEGRRAAERADLGLDDAATVFGIVAALRPEKNHEALLGVLARPELSHAHLLVVGDGARRRELEARARELGLDDRVHWLGWRDDVVGVLAAIDALVLPSHPNVETFPLCVLEAMAAARPAVVTDVGSLDEMVIDGQTGWIVPPGDDDALARALVEASDAAQSTARGEGARRRLEERFDEDQMLAKTAAILNEVVGKP